MKIFKPGAPAAGQRAWFLEIDLVGEVCVYVCMCVCVCVCVCVRPQG